MFQDIIAPAKINLFLHIVGKRDDGYHLLESLVGFTQFGDHLSIKPSDDLSLQVEGEFASMLDADMEQNLVLKTARLLQAHCNIKAGAQIKLHKALPVGSGLGGGSANAAAVLKALCQFWKVELDPALAAKLGADVAMCLDSSPAFAQGVGDKLQPMYIPPMDVVLVHPRQPLLTADVYRAFKLPFAETVEMPASIDSPEALVALLSDMHNGLQPAAIDCMPVIGDILCAIAATKSCLLARMSGSGSGCFGIYKDAAAAKNAAQELAANQPDWWCMATRLHNWGR